jgi:hypothetical protein
MPLRKNNHVFEVKIHKVRLSQFAIKYIKFLEHGFDRLDTDFTVSVLKSVSHLCCPCANFNFQILEYFYTTS